MATFNAGTIDATLDVDLDPFQRGLRIATQEGEIFGRKVFRATGDFNRVPFERSLGVAQRAGQRFAARTFNAKAGLDTTGLAAQVKAAQGELAKINGQQVRAHVDVTGVAGALAQVKELRRELAALNGTRVRVRFDLDGAAAAIAQLAAIQRALAAVDGRRANASAGVSGGITSTTTSSVTSFSSAVSSAAGKMQALIAIAALLAPALIPAFTGAAAAAGALLAVVGILGGAFVALGASVVGNVTGVLGAQKDLAAATKAVEQAGQAAAAAQQGVAAAAEGVQAAEQGLAQARQAAAAAVANAERALASANRGAQAAQEALTEARRDAADRLADYRDQLRGAALDEEAAELAVRRARVALANTLEDPESTKLDRDEAQLALQQALFQLDQVREGRDELQEQAKKDRKAGVEGSDEVKAARERLADANRAVQDAQRSLDEARESGARQIAAAQDSLAAANDRAATAAKAAADAQADLAKATADQLALTAKLSTPGARGFLDAIDAVKDAWAEFLTLTNGSSLAVASQFLDLLTTMLPKLAPLAVVAADAVGLLLDDVQGWMDGGGFDRMIAFLTDVAPDMIASFGSILGNLAGWFGGVVEAFAPFAQEMMDGLVGITDGWAQWASDLDQSPAFDRFLDFVRDTGPLFLETLGSIGGAFRNIGEALAPLAKPVLNALNDVFSGIADMDPTTLALLIGAAGAILAFTVAPVAGGALALLGFAAAFKAIHEEGGPAADVLEQIADLFRPLADEAERLAPIIREELMEAWEILQPQLSDFATFLEEDFGPKWKDFWDAVGPVVEWFAEYGGPALAGFFTVMLNAAKRALTMFGGLLDFVTGIFTGDIKRALGGLGTFVFGAITYIPRLIFDMFNQLVKVITGTSLTEAFSNAFGRVRDIATNVKNWVLDRLVRGDDSMIGRLKSGIGDGMERIGDLFDTLKGYAGRPIKFLVDTLYNSGIRKVVNLIPGVDNIGEVDTSDWGKFASGGVLPGYSPGVDNHTFHSRTAGTLHLSGGEGILIPQATKQLGGPKGIAYLNDRARAGTLSLGPLLEQSHAAGGVVYVDGEPLSKVIAAQLAVAETAAGYNMPVMQGSYQAPSDYSGTSHTGGGVMDTAPGNFGAQSWLRKVGLAAWGRNFTGAKTAGSGAHVHSVSLIDPAAVGNAQAAAYRAGGDGLGGSDYGPRPAPDPALMRRVQEMSHWTIGAGELQGMGTVRGAIGNPFAKFAKALEAVKDLVTKAPGWIKQLGTLGEWGGMMKDVGKSAVDGGLRGFINGKLPGSPMPKLFDQGGWLQPGAMAINLGDKPEPVLTDAQWRALAGDGPGAAGGLSKEDVDRLIEAIENNRGIYAPSSSAAELEAAMAGLGRELRKGSR